MIKKVISFFDRHRFILILTILFVIASIFLLINSLIFLNYEFKALECTKKIDDTYCYHNDTKILVDASESLKEFFNTYEEELNNLKKNFELPEFNYYTAYYYEKVALVNYEKNSEGEELYNFLQTYNRTYNIEAHYQKNNFYYEIFKPYKIPLNALTFN